MEYAAIAAVAAGLISSLIGVGKDAEAQALRQRMMDQYGAEILPHLDQAVAVRMGEASLGQMQEDPRLRNAQLDALTQLQGVYASGGMTAADRAAMELARNQVTAQTNARGAEAAQAMAQRGAVNSGLGYALNIAGQQAGANALGQMDLQSQVAARDRALRALEGSAGLAGNIRSDDFRRASELAGAQDRINMFNAQQQADANRYNLQLPQAGFDNLMMMLNARNNAASGVASGYERGAQAARETGAGVGNALLTYGMWGEKQKERK